MQLVAIGPGQGFHRAGDFLDEFVNLDGFDIKVHPTGFDSGEIQDVIN